MTTTLFEDDPEYLLTPDAPLPRIRYREEIVAPERALFGLVVEILELDNPASDLLDITRATIAAAGEVGVTSEDVIRKVSPRQPKRGLTALAAMLHQREIESTAGRWRFTSDTLKARKAAASKRAETLRQIQENLDAEKAATESAAQAQRLAADRRLYGPEVVAAAEALGADLRTFNHWIVCTAAPGKADSRLWMRCVGCAAEAWAGDQLAHTDDCPAVVRE